MSTVKAMPEVGARIELSVERVANGGMCVARDGDVVVFVRHTLPGERVIAEVTETTRRFVRADAVEILDASPDRVEAPCAFAGPGRCGGCDWQHASLDAQRRLKGEVVAEQLSRIAGIERDVEVEELPGAADGLGWRTRVRYAVDADGRPGLRRNRSHELEHIDRCRIAHPEVERVGVTSLPWPSVREIEVVASGAGDRAVVVSTRGPQMPTLPEPEAPAAVLRRGKGGRVQPLHGRKSVREPVGDRTFRVSPGGFWQVHPGAPEVLTGAVLDALRLEPGATVLDLYCGAGLFTAALADAVGEQGRVLGAEGDRDAVRDAEHNLRDLPWARVEAGDVAGRLREWSDLRADAAVLDPPRNGAGRDIVRSLSRLRRMARIAYVSCDPATLARDLAVFAEEGFALESLRAFDAFPMTQHVECVAVLAKEGEVRR